MGIDIEIWIRARPTAALMTKLRALRSEHGVVDSVYAVEHHEPQLDHIRISSVSRYFGRYYPRGWWPDIRAALVAIRDACPPGTQVEYGNDSSDMDSGI